VSGKKFCCCLIKGKKAKQINNKKPKNQNTTKQINPKFKCNTVSVILSASSSSSVIVSSKDKKNNNNKKRVWRKFCECLSGAAAHLPFTVSLLLWQALLMQLSGKRFTFT
jgi:hypothetical protein